METFLNNLFLRVKFIKNKILLIGIIKDVATNLIRLYFQNNKIKKGLGLISCFQLF
jgi:hypothetical protein